jgi:ribosomal protein S18 acetylase RimI-like enzyme
MSSIHGPVPINIRRAVEMDASSIRDLTCAAYEKWIAVLGRTPMPMLTDYDRAVREHMVDLLFHREVLAALIETRSEADHLLILNVAVLPILQKRGYGRRMLAHAEQLGSSLGFKELRLYTSKLYSANIALYTRLGYCINREEPFKGNFVVHMSKRIEARRWSG